ncbi:TIGR03086 family metal-binding protein, partial [Streptomyces oceani]
MISAPQQTTDPRPLLERATEQLAGLIQSVRPEWLTHRTPCAEWDVRALLGHVVEATGRFAELGERGDGAAMAAPTTLTGIPDDGWSAAYAEARARLRAAWADETKLAGTYALPWGTVPGHVALSGLLMDAVTHTWDLARGLDGRPELDGELARAALE